MIEVDIKKEVGKFADKHQGEEDIDLTFITYAEEKLDRQLTSSEKAIIRYVLDLDAKSRHAYLNKKNYDDKTKENYK